MGLFDNLKAPEKMDLAQGYNNKVSNTGNYSLPTKNVGVEEPKQKPLGDYSFLKPSSDYVPNTDFAQGIANYKGGLGDKLLGGLQEGLESLASGSTGGSVAPNINVSGFQFTNGQINPAQMAQAPQMQNTRLYDYLYM